MFNHKMIYRQSTLKCIGICQLIIVSLKVYLTLYHVMLLKRINIQQCNIEDKFYSVDIIPIFLVINNVLSESVTLLPNQLGKKI